MHGLTIWQPYASLIAAGFKRYEFRRWPGSKRLAGNRIAIHAAVRPVRFSDIESIRFSLADPETFGLSLLDPQASRMIETLRRSEYPRGAICATARLGDSLDPGEVASMAGLPESEVWRCNYAWPLSEIRAVVPVVPCRGRQGFWRVPPAVLDRVRDRELPE